MSDGIQTSHKFDKVIDIGGHSILPLLTTNLQANKYILYTSSMFLKNVYDSIREVKISYDSFVRVAKTINVHNNSLAISLAYEIDKRYNRVKTPCEKENVLYYGILYEYVSRLSYHLLSRAFLLYRKEQILNKKGVKLSRIYRKLDERTISMLWNEITTLKELLISSGRNIEIIYMAPNTMYKNFFKDEIYSKNVCFYSVFPSCVTTDELEWSMPNEDRRMLYHNKDRFKKLYDLCTENSTPFVVSTVYRVGMRIYDDLDNYIAEDKIKYKMYRATHNKSDIIVFGNKI